MHPLPCLAAAQALSLGLCLLVPVCMPMACSVSKLHTVQSLLLLPASLSHQQLTSQRNSCLTHEWLIELGGLGALWQLSELPQLSAWAVQSPQGL